jgi:hypothetical protein
MMWGSFARKWVPKSLKKPQLASFGQQFFLFALYMGPSAIPG